MKAVHIIAFALVIIGGLNWLLVAFNWNAVEFISFGSDFVARAIYVLVGLSALYLLFTHKKACRECMGRSSQSPMM
ncbi:MAG: DUF378 domain-containing protein [Candidatus Vogelbacteria bacterium CG10_big_fil_rev_8_21_14_0_10_50_13]|uniref:DUF378 domain-containing protein n=1 Tax=Candidatus Vogelbacteria bacterium CG10_big_fil_rev_8_21_14_0_10_50_13 TaxID=1975044 RepID=A0A2H0RFQ5_9BACT|nr:MAG: DUF378 domain-containing protein [Candidatus Vogelbacteria bacterium CG10_big_fil_rev_8_21_14_0_10_50_13]